MTTIGSSVVVGGRSSSSSTGTAAVVNKLLSRRVYRNLLRAAKPFTSPSPIASVLGCLLHRTSIDDHIQDWNKFIREPFRSGGGSRASTGEGSSGTDSTDDGAGAGSGAGGDGDIGDSTIASTRKSPEEARNLSISYIPTTSKNNTNKKMQSSSSKPVSTDRSTNHRTYQRLFRRLLREVVTGSEFGHAKMSWPSQVDTERLKRIIRREFRAESINIIGTDGGKNWGEGPVLASSFFDETTRLQVAMVTLRELHKKLHYFDNLSESSLTPVPGQAASNASALPLSPPSSFLRPGCFLVSHPLLNDGYFNKSVICILKHKSLNPDDNDIKGEEGRFYTTMVDTEEGLEDVSESSSTSAATSASQSTPPSRPSSGKESMGTYDTIPGQTYGVIVNRSSVNHETGRQRTLREAFQEHMLPARLADGFGNAPIRTGGPVHVALQMIHTFPSSASMSAAGDAIGGTLIPQVATNNNENESTTALYSDRATFFGGNMFKAIDAINDGTIDRDDVSFFVGASTWSEGQLAAEIAQGFWRPMSCDPQVALHGICEHEPPPPPPPPPPRLGVELDPTSDGDKTDNLTDGSSPSTATLTGNRRPLSDLWLSMMSAAGPEDSKLAHLFHHESWDECGLPCDSFIDDEGEDDDHDDDIDLGDGGIILF